MGYPLRFLGDDEPIDIDGTIVPGRMTTEVTFRVLHERMLLLPDAEATEIIGGCLGRAAQRYPGLGLHAVKVLGNHGHMLMTPDRAATLSCFMRDFKSTVGRRIGALRDRDGTFWSRRYRSIPVVDEAAIEERFEYLLTQGTKENLVARADDWPGVCSIRALRGGPPMIGRWRDKKAESELRKQRRRKIERARRRGEHLELGPVPRVYREYPVRHEPLPHWRHLPAGTRANIVAEIVRGDAAKTRTRHSKDGTRPAGVAAILRTSPFSIPKESKKGPAPACHASTRAGRRAFGVAYRAFCRHVRDSTRQLVEKRDQACVPAGTITGPVFDANVVRRSIDAPLTFEGGDERLHFDPFDAAAIAAFCAPTGPPAP